MILNILKEVHKDIPVVEPITGKEIPRLFEEEFEEARDLKDKVYKIIRRTYDRVLLKDKSGEFPLGEIDKLLAGVAVFVPGTTYARDYFNHEIAFMPNLKDTEGNSLTNIRFDDCENVLTDTKNPHGPIEINEKQFNFINEHYNRYGKVPLCCYKKRMFRLQKIVGIHLNN